MSVTLFAQSDSTASAQSRSASAGPLRAFPLQVRKDAKDRIENRVKFLSDVFGEKPQHEVTVFLQQCILAAIPAVGVRVFKMLPSVEFDHEPGV